MKNTALKETKKSTKRDEREPDYRKPKAAFDSVMDAYSTLPSPPRFSPMTTEADRAASRIRIAAELAMTLPFYSELPAKGSKKRGQGTVAAKGTPVKNPTAPSYSDFKIDCDKIIWSVIKSHQHRVEFILRYVLGEERLTKEQQHLFARYEQNIGRQFLRVGLYPVKNLLRQCKNQKVGAVSAASGSEGSRMTTSAIKLCECGCGTPTTIAIKNDTRAKMVKGQPMRFITGHSLRVLTRSRRGSYNVRANHGYIKDGVGYIPLTRNKWALVDAHNFYWLSQFNWCTHKSESGRWYAVRTVVLSNGTHEVQYMARLIMGVVDPLIQVDHKDHEHTLDNRESNLRIATPVQNSRNRGRSSNNTSGYKGVTWHKQHGKYHAKISVNYKRIHLGYFATAVEAAQAYNEAAIKYHRSFAVPNDLSNVTDEQCKKENYVN